MKKITFAVLTFLVSFCGFAQFEGFEGTWTTQNGTGPGGPAGWAIANVAPGPISYWVQANGTAQQPAHTGLHAAFLNGENVTNGTVTNDWLISPLITVPANGQLRFWSKLFVPGDQGTIYKVMISTVTTGTNPQTTLANFGATPLIQWDELTLSPDQDSWYEKVVSLAAYANQPVYIALVMQGDQGDRWVVDDFKVVQQCAPPTVGTATNIGATTATLNWLNPGGATAWEIEVIPQTATPTGVGVPVPGTAPTYNATGLIASTPYKFYVRSICGTGDLATTSTWAGPFNFATSICAASEQCNYTFTLTDSFGDGWNGATMTVSQNGIPVSTFGATFTTGAGPIVVTVPLCNGQPFQLYWTTGGTFPGEVGVSITNSFNQVLYTKAPGAGVPVSVLYTGTGNCLTPECLPVTGLTATNITTNSASLNWSGTSPGNWQYYVVPTGSPAPTAATTGTVTTTKPVTATLNSLTSAPLAPATTYQYYVRLTCAGGTFSTWAGPFSFTTLATCLPPTNLAAGAFTATSATFNWTASPSTPGSYDVYWATTSTAPTATTVPTSNVPGATTTQSGLAPSSTYYIWVRSHCSDTDTSTWVGPLSFTTPQVPTNLPIAENWDTGTLNGWTLANGTQTNKWFVGTATFNSPGNSLYVSNNNGVANAYTITANSTVHAYRDVVVPAGTSDVNFSFDWKNVGENGFDYIRVWIVPVGFTPTPGTQITAAADRVQVGANFVGNAAWTTYSNILNWTAFGNSNRRIVFEWRNDGSGGVQPPAAVDNINVSVITCPQPSNLTVAATSTATSATFNWTAPATAPASYDYYVSNTSTPPTGATVPTGNVTATTYTHTPLTPSTTYYFWVRSHCSGTDSSFWTGPVSYTTPQIPEPLTYTDNFEGTIGWTMVNGTQANKWVVGTATSNSPTHSMYITNDNGATNNYTINTASTVQAYRDLLMPASGDISISFDWKNMGENCCDYIRVWMVPATFVPVAGTQITAAAGRVQLGGNLVGNANWTTANFVQNITAYGGQARRLVFEWRNDGSLGTPPPAAIDNVSVSAITCPQPTTILASAITQTSANITWAETGTATSWEVLVQPTANAVAPTATTTTGVTVTGTPAYTASPLTSGTSYTVYVRSVCSGTDKSFWSGPYVFYTAISNDDCAAAIPLPVNNNSLCTQTTLATIAGATTSAGAPATCFGTANDDVWYEFTATSTQHYIALLNVGGTQLSTDNMVHAVYSGSCGSLVQVSCSDPNNSIINNLVVGQTYKVRIWSNATTPQAFGFRICVGIVLTCGDSQAFCANADSNNITFPGSLGVPNLGPVSCLLTTPNPTYYFLQIEDAGNLQLNISQTSFNGTPIDVDFIAYGPFTNLDTACVNLTTANQVGCSYSAAAVENFTITNAPADSYYVVMITNFNGSQGTINFSQTNQGQPNAGQTNCDIVCTVDFGPDLVLCETASYTLDSGLINAESYVWTLNGGVIPGATGQTYVATQSGIYGVTVTKPSCDTNPTDFIELTFLPDIALPAPAGLTLCSTNGTATADLAAQVATILGTLNPADYVVEFYTTQAAATAGTTGAIDTTTPYNATATQTLYVRVEHAALGTCFEVYPFPITVNAAPVAAISYADAPFCSTETTGTVTQTGNAGGVYSSTTGLTIDPATGAINIATSTPGTYTVTYTIAPTASCPGTDATFVVLIEAAPTATISYGTAPYCSNAGTAAAVVTGTQGGTFTADAGVVIDAATGAIDLAASTAGTFTVTYTIADTANCLGTSTTAQITITELPVAAISYAASPYCSDAGIATVTLTGDAGGTYTADAGLSINATTGEINLAASAAGTYTVTYTIAAAAGCDAVPAVATVVITQLPVAGFSYAYDTYCQNAGNQAVQLDANASAGIFTVDVAGLTIDAATGAIIPGTSQVGTYVVTNTIAAANGCSDVPATFTVTITAAPDAAFSYAAVAYCQSETTNPLPVINGVTGTFTASPAGLAINPATGEVDLANSEPGTYTVTNTITGTPNCPDVSIPATITITSQPVLQVGQGCEENRYMISVNFDDDDVYSEDTVTFEWSKPDGTFAGNTVAIDITGMVPGTYTVEVTPINGAVCPAIAEVEVVRTTCSTPKGISPNGDTLNDNFDLTGFDVKKLEIFNRYGKQVYSFTGNYTNEFGGVASNGENLPSGTYFYMFQRGNGTTETGWVYINFENN
jgi:gliding motility-associated-like protein